MFSPAAQQTTPRGSLAFSPSALVSPTATKEGSNPPSKESSPEGTASSASGGEVKGAESGSDGVDGLFVAGIGCMKSQTAAYIEKHEGDDVVLAKTGVVKLTYNGKDAMVVLPSEVRSSAESPSPLRFHHFNLTVRDRVNPYFITGRREGYERACHHSRDVRNAEKGARREGGDCWTGNDGRGVGRRKREHDFQASRTGELSEIGPLHIALVFIIFVPSSFPNPKGGNSVLEPV